MSKRKLKQIWGGISAFSNWYFFGLFIIFLIVGVMAVRQNNLKSIELRNTVTKADEQNGDVESALNDLRLHIYSHMNASLSSTGLQQPIQLKYRYERLVAEQQKKSAQTQKLYRQAQDYCEDKFGAGSLSAQRVPCVQEYVSKRDGTEPPPIPEELYKFDFVSPRWSPDLAGWSLLFSGIFLALFVIRVLVEKWFKAQVGEDI
jgi:hypothetical protein